MFSYSSSALAARKERPAIVQPPTISLTPTVGGIFFSDGEGLEASPLYGIKLSYDINGKNIADSLGIEGTFNYFSTKSTKGTGDVTGYIYRVDAIYPFTPGKKWVPFFAAGLGGINKKSSTSTEISPLVNYGAGVKYFIDDYLALRVDARHLIVYHEVDTRNNFELSVALTYIFGKEPKKKPAAPPARPKLPPKIKPKEETFQEPSAPEPPTLSVLEKLGLGGGSLIGITPEYEPPRQPINKHALALKPKEEATKPIPATPPTETAAPKEATPPTETAAPKEQEPVIVSKPERHQVTQKMVLNVEFDTDQAVIKKQYSGQVKELAQLIKHFSGSSVIIEGHTDSSGGKRHNIKLSLRRAAAVKKALIGYGIGSEKITLKAYGSAKPVADNATAQGKQRNRRTTAIIVEIVPQ